MSHTKFNLQRFLDAQEGVYPVALKEIRNGGKRSHWIWYIFPQQKGLGYSYNSEFYGLDGEEEARAYLAHPVLGVRLREISHALLGHRGHRTVRELMGSEVDVLKLHTSMKLFDKIAPGEADHRQKRGAYRERCGHRRTGNEYPRGDGGRSA